MERLVCAGVRCDLLQADKWWTDAGEGFFTREHARAPHPTQACVPRFFRANTPFSWWNIYTIFSYFLSISPDMFLVILGGETLGRGVRARTDEISKLQTIHQHHGKSGLWTPDYVFPSNNHPFPRFL